LAALGAFGLALATVATPAAVAQDISSADGLWRATLDPFAPGTGTGQITNLYTPASSTTDNLFETLWYEASDYTGGVSARVESIYTNISSNIGADSASFALMRNDGLMQLDVNVSMIDGAAGGARFSLTWTNMGSAPESVKGFAYADLDIDGSAGGDNASWDAAKQSILQSQVGSIYFGGLESYAAWEITTFSSLRTALDGGVTELASAGGGTNADFTGAISGNAMVLGSGESMTFRFQLGGPVPAPGALALLGLAGLTGTRRRRG
jgi:MYXO-CTERM domain-containing protein